MKKTLLSAVQPTSRLTLGNYLGALRQWVHLQPDYDCLFFAVDLHALTVPQQPTQLRGNTYRALATYLAAGVDPKTSTVFVQSHVRQHAELAWILTCQTGMGELARMTQFKDKTEKVVEGDHVGVGLFTYPVLMAADILLYGTHLVPVGNDQLQHIQLARDLAQRVNHRTREKLFVLPEAHVAEVGARVMSLQEPTRKMSKSDPIDGASVFLTDSNSEISKKIKRSVTDPGSEVTEDPGPGVENLLQIYAACTGAARKTALSMFLGDGYGRLKTETADAVVSIIAPIRDRMVEILQDTSELESILRDGAGRARERAELTLRRVYDSLGMVL